MGITVQDLLDTKRQNLNLKCKAAFRALKEKNCPHEQTLGVEDIGVRWDGEVWLREYLLYCDECNLLAVIGEVIDSPDNKPMEERNGQG